VQTVPCNVKGTLPIASDGKPVDTSSIHAVAGTALPGLLLRSVAFENVLAMPTSCYLL